MIEVDTIRFFFIGFYFISKFYCMTHLGCIKDMFLALSIISHGKMVKQITSNTVFSRNFSESKI